MEHMDAKDILHRYLRMAREALLWKLESLSEYDARRPLTPTGTNVRACRRRRWTASVS